VAKIIWLTMILGPSAQPVNTKTPETPAKCAYFKHVSRHQTEFTWVSLVSMLLLPRHNGNNVSLQARGFHSPPIY
jgi:hypothetical protein